MARLPILTYPAKSLRKPSVQVERVSSKLQDLVGDMIETMNTAEGIGLAAPQIGENLNILVMDVPVRTDTDKPAQPTDATTGPLCFINPRILQKSGTTQYEEGCLSCPELIVSVDRASELLVEALDVEGRLVKHHLTGLAAICLQHEMDHLAGKLLTDYISRLKRELYKKERIRNRTDQDPKQ